MYDLSSCLFYTFRDATKRGINIIDKISKTKKKNPMAKSKTKDNNKTKSISTIQNHRPGTLVPQLAPDRL